MSNQSILIPVFTGAVGDESAQLVNARDLHYFLESKQDFSTWIKSRINDYAFVESVDYLLHKFMEQLPSGAKNKIDYHLTLDMAKELAMVERNAKGREARRYFIACEKRLLDTERRASLANEERNASIPAAAPTRLALLKEITGNTTRFINSTSALERETLAMSLCEMNRMAGFADRLNGQILAELNASPYVDRHAERVIAQFWHNVEQLEKSDTINHSAHPEKIAINLTYFIKLCERENLPTASLAELNRYLPFSTSPRFITNKQPIRSCFLAKTVRCVLFNNSKQGA